MEDLFPNLPAIDFEEGLRRVCAQYTDGTAETSSVQ